MCRQRQDDCANEYDEKMEELYEEIDFRQEQVARAGQIMWCVCFCARG